MPSLPVFPTEVVWKIARSLFDSYSTDCRSAKAFSPGSLMNYFTVSKLFGGEVLQLYRQRPVTLPGTGLQEFLKWATQDKSGWKKHSNLSVHIFLDQSQKFIPSDGICGPSWQIQKFEDLRTAYDLITKIELSGAIISVFENAGSGFGRLPDRVVPCVGWTAESDERFEGSINAFKIHERMVLNGAPYGNTLRRSLSAAQAHVSLTSFSFTGRVVTDGSHGRNQRKKHTHTGFSCPRCMLVDVIELFPRIAEIEILPVDEVIYDCDRAITAIKSANCLKVLQIRVTTIINESIICQNAIGESFVSDCVRKKREIPSYILRPSLEYLILHFHEKELDESTFDAFDKISKEKLAPICRDEPFGEGSFRAFMYYNLDTRQRTIPLRWPYDSN
ncbi:hypothetical protein TWF106_006462 [Orbilia oligospora]|uniref:Uncharacterized protein n=1 Tax=Orbilia oligospora TaxID=2813651 RepID=A0A7C8URR0_ORBOL|nr:hypothetical protein TWF106_006462 [Orbilia oligospora]